MKRKIFGILFALVLVLSLSLVMAVPVSAGAITSIAVTPADDTAGATTDYSIAFTPDTGGATHVDIDFTAFGTTATDMVLSAVSTTIADYSFTGFSVNPTGVGKVVNGTNKIQFTGGTTAATTVHTIVNAVGGTGLVITNDQDAETQNVTITTTSDTGSVGLTINPDSATKFVIIDPTDGTVDAAITVTVEAQDQFGNKDTTYALDVTLVTDGSATGAGVVTIAAGTGSLPISDQVAETVNLSLTDHVPTGLDCTSTQDVVFAPGVATKFVIIDPTDGTVDAAITVTVEAQDQYSNLCDSGPNTYAQDVTLVTDGSATGAGLVDIVAGTGSLPISDQVAETVNLSLLDSQTTGLDCISTQDVVFAVGAIDHYSVSTITSPQVAGTAFNVTIQAQDQYNNNITTGAETVTITFGLADTGATPITTATTNGTVTVSMTMTVAQTGQSITFTGVTWGKTGISNSFDVTSPPIGGGWGAPPTPTIETNLFGEVFRFRFHITTRGEIRDTIQATSGDGMLTMTIPAGTIALDKNGKPLSTLTSDVDVSPPPPPSHIIGLAYNFSPDGATFDPAITLTWSYDPDALPEGVAEEDLVILWYDEEAGEWVECDFTCAPETDCVTARVCHFTTFAIIAHAAPAAFSTSNLSIQPSEVQPKEAVTITLSVANTGGMEGSYAVVLKIDDVKEAEKDVTIAAGSSQSVTFSVTKEKAGSYSVDVNGLSGSFTVKEKPAPTPPPPPAPPPEVTPPFNWPLVGGIIGAVIVVGLLIFFLVVRRRA